MKFPKIDSPCPIRWTTLPAAGKDFCTRCERQVHDLSAMTEAQRRQFLASCSGKTCVAYAVSPARPVAALRMGRGIIAAIAAAPALAGSPMAERAAPPMSPAATAAAIFPQAAPRVECDEANTRPIEPELLVVVGGTLDPQGARWLAADEAVESLPTVPDSAFLDGEAVEFVEPPSNPRP